MDENTRDGVILISLTADIVAAYVSNNNFAAGEVPSFIANVHGALAGLGAAQEEEEKAEPAVSIRASVKRDHLVCLGCGRKMKTLKRHIANKHEMTPAEYRTRWNLPSDYPMVSAEYSDKRRALAKEIGLGGKPAQRPGRRKIGLNFRT